MTVQTEIDRISDNITNALAAIADKGVTVPDGSTSDALAELIAGIEAGGDVALPSNITEISGGTYVAAEDLSQSFYIQHGMGVTPTMAVMWSASTNTGSLGWGIFFNGGGGMFGSGKGTSLAYADLSSNWRRGAVIDKNTIKPSLPNTGTSAYAGDTFYWLAWV